MNKVDLETKIEGLKKAITEHEDFTGTYKSQLETAEQDLKEYFLCDTLLRKQGLLYFCRLIEEIEYEEINI